MQLVISSRGFSLAEARDYAFEEIFQNDKTMNGAYSFEQFEQAYKEMASEEGAGN